MPHIHIETCTPQRCSNHTIEWTLREIPWLGGGWEWAALTKEGDLNLPIKHASNILLNWYIYINVNFLGPHWDIFIKACWNDPSSVLLMVSIPYGVHATCVNSYIVLGLNLPPHTPALPPPRLRYLGTCQFIRLLDAPLVKIRGTCQWTTRKYHLWNEEISNEI